MDEGIRPRLTPAQAELKARRDFGAGLAVILCVFAALAWHKGRGHWPATLTAAALSFALSRLAP